MFTHNKSVQTIAHWTESKFSLDVTRKYVEKIAHFYLWKSNNLVELKLLQY